MTQTPTSIEKNSPCNQTHAIETFAILQEQKIIEELIRHWQRRNHSILNIGCGTGVFLEKFWAAGLDVTGIDSNPDKLEKAQQRIGNKAELRLGAFDHLPFENNSFDYTALMLTAANINDSEKAIQEAIRVSTDGILVSFFNKWSLNYLYQYYHKKQKENLYHLNTHQSFNPFKIYSFLSKDVGYSKISIRSTLFTPHSLWGKTGFLTRLNNFSSFLPFGGILAICLDLKPSFAVKPLWLKTENTRAECS
ncbi:class I SAM-dependent methyltransferase [Desulfovibrio litoralis]|uniref:Methyltransferase domain-containing protein n=1 Tax=Desulfovibrio litoralis DSM 11393 TaxID=1121455 RepID=A0A1M7S002_9BACT|nr:class I SAM-dependent methyltransferase [Desulfovibrio litoralis]SHN51644.1 Methyltransferase domain-containing protein [Desulfovibrio litoralis DSM 11393]